MQDELIQSAAVDSLSSTPETPPAVRGSMYLEPRERTVLAMIEAAAAVGHRAPKNAQISAALRVSRMMGSYYVTRLEQLGLISVERFAQSRIITIMATGAKTAGTQPDLPPVASGESAGGPRVVSASSLTSPETAPESIVAPAALSERTEFSPIGDSHIPLDIERVRAMREVKPVNLAFTVKDRCQYIHNASWPFKFCGAKRASGQNPYCAEHAAMCGAGYSGTRVLGTRT